MGMDNSAMQPFVVIISANAEWQVVRDYFPDCLVCQSPFGEWFLHEFSIASGKSESVILVHGGWGKVAAGASTQFVIDAWQPRLIINLGTCGGFAGDISCHDVVLAEKTVIYDIYEQMGDPDEHISHYTTLLDTSWITEPCPIPVIRSLLVSADRDLFPDEIPMLKAKFGAKAGDWESGAIAWVANKNHTPCVILRGVTDLVGGDGGEAYDGNISFFHRNTGLVMKRLLDSLPGWLLMYTRHHPSARLEK